MTPQISPVASRYANAFVDTIVENKAQKAVASDIESLKSIYVDSPEFADFTSNAVISRDEKRSVIEAMAKKAKFHDLTVNFLKLLIENGRLGNLVEMINAYDVVMDERAGNTIVSVVSAFPLKAAQEKKIKAELDKALDTNVQIISEVDQTLLGGVVITVGSKMIDDSIKGKLERLSRAMKSQSDEDSTMKKAS